MPLPSVVVPHREFLDRCKRHDVVVQGLPLIDPKLQKLLAELVMMRLFDEFQFALSGIALRLASGASYADGSSARLLTAPAPTIATARILLENHGRPKRVQLKWSKVSYINSTIKNVLDPGDTFGIACSASALAISEMQAIRNRIAHSNKNSRMAFAQVVRRYYGANLNHVSPGHLLLSPRQSPHLLSRYITACRVTVKSCAGA